MNRHEYGFNPQDFMEAESWNKIEVPLELMLEIHAYIKEHSPIRDVCRQEPVQSCGHVAIHRELSLDEKISHVICGNFSKTKEELRHTRKGKEELEIKINKLQNSVGVSK